MNNVGWPATPCKLTLVRGNVRLRGCMVTLLLGTVLAMVRLAGLTWSWASCVVKIWLGHTGVVLLEGATTALPRRPWCGEGAWWWAPFLAFGTECLALPISFSVNWWKICVNNDDIQRLVLVALSLYFVNHTNHHRSVMPQKVLKEYMWCQKKRMVTDSLK